MKNKKFKIVGQVIDQKTKKGMLGLRIEAWDKDLIFNDLVGETITDKDGNFRINFDESYFKELFLDRQPDLFFKIYKDKKLIRSTEDSIFWNVSSELTQVTIEVDLDEAGKTKKFTVKGKAINPDRTPASGLVIRAYDKVLGGEQLLGSTTTKGDGSYQITYASGDLGKSKKQADLIVKAFKTKTAKRPLFTSPLILNALPNEEVNMIIGLKEDDRFVPTSEFELVAERLETELSGADLEKLMNNQDIAYLSNVTRIDPTRITFYLRAKSFGEETKIEAEIFYGLFRQQLPTNLPTLLSQDSKVLRNALKTASETHIISPKTDEDLDQIIEALTNQIVKQVFKITAPEEKPVLLKLLDVAEIKKDKQKNFLETYVREKKDIKTFWQKLRKDNYFKDKEPDIQLTFQLGFFTLNHPPLVEKLRQYKKIKHPRDLVLIPNKDWEDMISDIALPSNIKGKNNNEKKENYLRAIFRLVDNAFPTAAIARELKIKNKPEDKDFLTFMKNHPELEFGRDNIRIYLQQHPKAFQGIKDKKIFLKEIQARKRVFKLIPPSYPDKYQVFDILWSNKLHAAQSIVRMGSSTFNGKIKKLLNEPGVVREIYRIAQHRYSTSLMIMARYHAQLNNVPLHVIPRTDLTDLPTDPTSERLREILDGFDEEGMRVSISYLTGGPAGGPLAGIPNLQEMFGSLDYCKCRHCRSVLSPAAYLVDLLVFLDQIPVPESNNDNIVTAKEQLLLRRPDLKHIDLTCKNTDTVMPYIDLVNEVLENIVGILEVPKKIDKEEFEDQIIAEISEISDRDFIASVYELDGNSYVLMEDLPQEDRTRIIQILNLVGYHDYITIPEIDVPQTEITAEELKSMPEHINRGAYDKLYKEGDKPVVYPWVLPFKLWWEEARVYLDHLGIPRHEIMQHFHNEDAPPSLEPIEDYNSAIAAEVLCLNPWDWKIINGDETCTVEEHYGVENLDELKIGDDPAKIGVEALLQKTQLAEDRQVAYETLQELLQSHFINPDRKPIQISDDESCALEKATLDLSEDEPKKLYRFRRLQTKLGWSVVDLDKTITALSFDDQFLLKLSYIKRLLGELKVSPLTIVSWWSPIDTVGKISTSDQSPWVYKDINTGNPVPSLYEKLFLNQTVNNPLLENLFQLNADRSDLKDNTGRSLLVEQYTTAVLAGLNLDGDDLRLLIESQEIPDDTINLANLSHLYRIATFCKAVRISIKEYIALRQMNNQTYLFSWTDVPGGDEGKLRRFLMKDLGIEWAETADIEKDNEDLNISTDDYAATITIDEAKKTATLKIGEVNTLVLKVKRENGKLNIYNGAFIGESVNPEITFRFWRKILKKIKASGFSIEELDYLLRHNYEPKSPLPSSEKATTVFLEELRTELNQLITANPIEPVEKQQALEMKLPVQFSGEEVKMLKEIILHTADKSDAESFIANHPGLFPDAAEAKSKLLPPDPPAEAPALDVRIQYVLDLMGMGDDSKFIFLRNKLISTLGGGTDLIRRIIEEIVAIVEKKSNKVKDDQIRFIQFHFSAIGLDQTDARNKLVQGESGYIDDDEDRLDYMLEVQLAIDPSTIVDTDKRKAIINALNEKLLPGKVWLDKLIGTFLGIIVKKANLAEEEQRLIVDDFFGLFMDSEDAKEKLVTGGGIINNVDKRFDYVIRTLLLSNHIIQKFADYLDIETGIAALLLIRYLNNPDNPEQKAIEVFQQYANYLDPEEEIEPSKYAEQFKTFKRIYKTTMLLSKFKARPDELAFIFRRGTTPEVGWLDPAALPLAEDDPSAEMEGFIRLCDVYRLQEELFPSDESIFELLEMGHREIAPAEILNELIRITNWEKSEIEFLTGVNVDPPGSGYNYAATDFKNEKWLLKLEKAFKISKQIGVPTSQIWGWNMVEVSEEKSRAIRNSAKSKYDSERWLEIAPPLRDVLRIKQRDALQAYIIAQNERFRDVNDLYSYYLIDTQMQPCMMTSRIKQANASIQLFIQRLLFGLEVVIDNGDQKTIEVSTDKAREWQWRKYYRVWEANRKVFLYPENWIEPELRLDKTPFFEDLENELLQDEVNDQTAERVFMNYLEKLDQVSRLEIMGMYLDEERNIIHVVGRTFANPHIYYHRKWINKAHWAPWEKVEVDIQGDHLIPVIYNRRLYLFWPTFTEKAIKNTDPPKKYWEIQLAWTEYKDGKWTAKKVSTDKINDDLFFEKRSFYIFSSIVKNPDDLKISSFYVQPSKGDLIVALENPSYYPSISWSDSSLTQGFNQGDFMFMGCQMEPVVGDYIQELFERVPNAGPYNNKYITLRTYTYGDSDSIPEGALTQPLSHYHLSLYVDNIYQDNTNMGEKKQVTLLNNAKDAKIIIPHQIQYYLAREPFFFEDTKRAFFVVPKIEEAWVRVESTSDVEVVVLYDEEFTLKVEPIYKQLAVEFFSDVGVAPDVDPHPGYVGDDTVTNNIWTRRNELKSEGYYAHSQKGKILDREPFERYLADVSGNVTHKYVRFLTDPQVMRIAGTVFPEKEKTELEIVWRKVITSEFTFHTFYHPYVCLFIKQLNRYGIDGLLNSNPKLGGDSSDLQRQRVEHEYFDDETEGYGPTDVVKTPYPKDTIDFGEEYYREDEEDEKKSISFSERRGAYSQYNWELFFHAPLLIATRLSQNQKFEEAQKWFHYIFNPTETDGAAPQRFWKIKPFYIFYEADSATHIKQLLNLFQPDREATTSEKESLIQQILEWQDNPFQPHLIASFRTVAYMRTVVMKYLDNLVAWADHLFRRFTIESINEATQLYVLAAQILGKKPVQLDKEDEDTRNVNEVLGELPGLFDDLETELEDLIEDYVEEEWESGTSVLDSIFSEYFCIPPNTKLLSYWDTVADRLFKIRHCMDIEGVVRQLPLFEPPIDPGMLVRAVAAGVDLSSAINDIYAPLPHYRFGYVLQKALELCNDVKTLGSTLLSALEKKDAEEISRLRAGHEVNLLKAVKEIRKKGIKESEETLESTRIAKKLAETRKEYYESREFMNFQEKAQITSLKATLIMQLIKGYMDILSSVLHIVPNSKIGAGTTAGTTFGGENLGMAAGVFSSYLGTVITLEGTSASIIDIMGRSKRRQDDWDFQKDLAVLEIDQMEKQILAGEIRLAMAEKELDNHELQIEQSQEVDEFMRDKFTNQQLYGWMSGQISGLYFQAYQLAYDVAKQAEKAFQHELGTDTSFIEFGYWDSRKKGLLAGEKLSRDLKRLEMAYLDKNKREYELTKHISLTLVNPENLIQLRETGSCFFEIPELLFDLEYPSHYMRRIKSVSLSIPCVTGPYTSVNAKLSLMGNRIRKNTKNTSNVNDYDYGGIEDDRFTHNLLGGQSIATSGGQNDSGVFELNFRDERYLPFEGAGAISSWQLELPNEFRQFDYDTISDVIIHMNYTARDGGDALKETVVDYVKTAINYWLDEIEKEKEGLFRLISMKQEFSTEFHQFLNPAAGNDFHKTTFTITPSHFPHFFKERTIEIISLTLVLKLKEKLEESDVADVKLSIVESESGDDYQSQPFILAPKLGDLPAAEFSVGGNPELDLELCVQDVDPDTDLADFPSSLKIDGLLDPNKFEDILILITYTI